MLGKARDWLRRRVRARQWGGDYPILLPHVTVEGDVVRLIDGTVGRVGTEIAAALRTCDGRFTLREVCGRTGVPASELVRCHDLGWLVFWRTPLSAGEIRALAEPMMVLSPHPDDAALSIGGYLTEWGGFVRREPCIVIVNVFSQARWWRFGEADAAKVTQVRRHEEELVARMLGAELRMMELPEALLRGYSIKDVFGEERPEADQQVREVLREELTRMADERRDAAWALPLGVGNHVDHRIVRDVAMEVLEHRGVSMGNVFFYEDLPYAGEAGGVADYSKQVGGKKLEAEFRDIERVLRWKLELNRVYWSQFTWSRVRGLGEYARRLGKGKAIERRWAVKG